MVFTDRYSAGLLLLEKLASWRGKDCVILGLARGGVVVASVIASGLNVPLDVIVVKKIPAPGQSELAIGALAPEGVSFVDGKFATRVGADENYVRTQISELNDQIKKRTALYRKGRKPLDVRDKTVILVDDGVATGATIAAAIKWARKKHARKIIAATGVMPADTVAKIQPEVEELVALEAPSEFGAVGQFYRDFPQVEDPEVVELMKDSKKQRQ